MINSGDIALLFSGQCRTLEKCTESIFKTFPGADIYCHAYLDEDSSRAELLNPLRCLIEPSFEMPERKEYTWKVGNYCYSVQGVLKQLWTLKRSWEVYARSNKKHKWVARCRYDIAYFNELEDFSNWDCDLILPKHDNWWGFHDRFGIMRYEVAERYFTRINLLDQHIDNSGMFHPETFLKAVMQPFKIERTNLVTKTIRKDGTIVEPSYRLDCGDIL